MIYQSISFLLTLLLWQAPAVPVSLNGFDTNIYVESPKCRIPPKSSEQTATLLEKAELNVNDANNILKLPNKKGASLKIFKNATIHEGKHSNDYFKTINKEIDKIMEKGKKANFSQEQYKNETYKLIGKFKSQLISGDLPLNSLVRPK
jgi:hypothetical protein